MRALRPYCSSANAAGGDRKKSGSSARPDGCAVEEGGAHRIASAATHMESSHGGLTADGRAFARYWRAPIPNRRQWGYFARDRHDEQTLNNTYSIVPDFYPIRQ